MCTDHPLRDLNKGRETTGGNSLIYWWKGFTVLGTQNRLVHTSSFPALPFAIKSVIVRRSKLNPKLQYLETDIPETQNLIKFHWIQSNRNHPGIDRPDININNSDRSKFR